jgi:hypothetical protein
VGGGKEGEKGRGGGESSERRKKRGEREEGRGERGLKNGFWAKSARPRLCQPHIILNTVIWCTFSCGSDNDTERGFKAGRALWEHIRQEDCNRYDP